MTIKFIALLITAACLTACGSQPKGERVTNDSTQMVTLEPLTVTLASDTLIKE